MLLVRWTLFTLPYYRIILFRLIGDDLILYKAEDHQNTGLKALNSLFWQSSNFTEIIRLFGDD